MKFTKMDITGHLNNEDSARFAGRIGLSYLIAAIGVALAALIYAVRWW